MKKLVLVGIGLFGMICSSFAQEKESEKSKWSYTLQPRLGFAKYEQSGLVTLNGTFNAFDVFLTRKIAKNLDLTSGVMFSTFDANYTLAGESARLQNDYVQIPLLLGGKISFDEKSDQNLISMRVSAGPVASFLARQENQTIAGKVKDENLGWNFGILTQLTVDFRVSDRSAVYFGLQGQSDFTRIEDNGSENKIQQSSSILFGYRGTF
ncbi:hypothetical protein [Flavobacterium sp.]|uniref:hypothetical protein n=1 Tax=Flavobacterium sp. TaxID=239 RepID=UPI003B9B5BCB